MVDQPIDTKTVWHACHKAAQRAGLKKKVHPHALRHYAEFRTMPSELLLAPFWAVLRKCTRHSFSPLRLYSLGMVGIEKTIEPT